MENKSHAFAAGLFVLAVTALRDGMNLVAKEYIASRVDGRGVLVLSEFTGAADELTQAIRVNPHDIEGLKDAIMTAIEMPEDEQRRRMRALRRRVRDHGVADWSRAFLGDLGRRLRHAFNVGVDRSPAVVLAAQLAPLETAGHPRRRPRPRIGAVAWRASSSRDISIRAPSPVAVATAATTEPR